MHTLEVKNKIGFWHDIDDKAYWKDGLYAAIELLKKDFEIIENTDCDVNIVWTGSGNLKPLNGKIIWLYAGGAFEPSIADVTVVEDNYAKRKFAEKGVNAQIAFGTNTDLFKPISLEKEYDIIFPGAFARWKRHDLLVEWAKGKKVLVVGYKQKVETECYEICEAAGFTVKDRVTPEELAVLYNQSKECWIPSETMGGSQRTLLEARACGLPVRVDPDNERLNEMLTQRVPSHYEYAQKLKDIILSTTQ